MATTFVALADRRTRRARPLPPRTGLALRTRRGVARTALLIATGLAPVAAAATDLAGVYAQARDYDATLRAARFDHEAALQQLPLARSAFLPQLSVGANATYGYVDPDDDGSSAALGGTPGEGEGETDPNLVPLDSDDDDDTYTSTALSLSASQTLFNRTNSALLDQARFGVRQADAQLLAVQQTLILRTASAYFDVLRAQAGVEFSQSELQAIGRQREQAERRFDVGLVPVTDVRSARAQYDLAIAQEITASNTLSAAREALRVIAGIDVERLAPLADDLPLASPDPADIDAWVALADEQNLQLVGARLAAESARAQVAVERGARYPTLELVGSASRSETDPSGRSDGTQAEIGLQLQMPLFTGGRVGAQVAQARARAGSALEQLAAEQRTVTQQARDGYRGVRASISRVRALRQALVSTQQSADATEAGFRAGTRTSIDVLQALRDVFRARSDYAGARYDYLINLLNLKAAAGTLNEGDVDAVNRFLVPLDAEESENGGESGGEDGAAR